MGFDWLTLDMEHQAFDWAQAATIFAVSQRPVACHWCDCPTAAYHYIKRVDAGAWGIVVPMVDTVEQRRTAIAAAKYPPVGNRSLGGGLHSLNLTRRRSTTSSEPTTRFSLCFRRKAPRGIENAEAIYSCLAWTRFSSDRSTCGRISVRRTVQPADDAALEAAISRVVATRQKGRLPPPECTRCQSDTALGSSPAQGMQFIAVGSELRMMTSKAQSDDPQPAS